MIISLVTYIWWLLPRNQSSLDANSTTLAKMSAGRNEVVLKCDPQCDSQFYCFTNHQRNMQGEMSFASSPFSDTEVLPT